LYTPGPAIAATVSPPFVLAAAPPTILEVLVRLLIVPPAPFATPAPP
jgi:hypothetical protein